MPALVLDEAADRFSWGGMAASVVLVVHVLLTGWAYFGCHMMLLPRCVDSAQARAEAYQAEATELADQARAAAGSVILPERLYTTYPSLRFLLPDSIRYVDGEPLPAQPEPVTIFAWPYDGIEQVWAALPGDTSLFVQKGALMDGGAGGD
ncbi:MAG: hypothetical protein ACFB51_04005, partial [Anaerolineae bacterium]